MLQLQHVMLQLQQVMLQLQHVMLQLEHVMLQLQQVMLQLQHVMLQLEHVMLELEHVMLQLMTSRHTLHLYFYIPFIITASPIISSLWSFLTSCFKVQNVTSHCLNSK
jgi:hypothetical protein